MISAAARASIADFNANDNAALRASAAAPSLEGSSGGAGADALAASRLAAAAEIKTAVEAQVRSIHWFPYDPVRVVNADP